MDCNQGKGGEKMENKEELSCHSKQKEKKSLGLVKGMDLDLPFLGGWNMRNCLC